MKPVDVSPEKYRILGARCLVDGQPRDLEQGAEHEYRSGQDGERQRGRQVVRRLVLAHRGEHPEQHAGGHADHRADQEQPQRRAGPAPHLAADRRAGDRAAEVAGRDAGRPVGEPLRDRLVQIEVDPLCLDRRRGRWRLALGEPCHRVERERREQVGEEGGDQAEREVVAQPTEQEQTHREGNLLSVTLGAHQITVRSVVGRSAPSGADRPLAGDGRYSDHRHSRGIRPQWTARPRRGTVTGVTVNATAAALLGLLHDGPMTGGQLVAAAGERFGAFFSVTRSQVYRELPVLAEAGLLKPGQAGPARVAAVRDHAAGRRAFKAWLAAGGARTRCAARSCCACCTPVADRPSSAPSWSAPGGRPTRPARAARAAARRPSWTRTARRSPTSRSRTSGRCSSC